MMGTVAYDRDVRAFHDRAPGYETGYRGHMHHDIVARTAELALRVEPQPRRVLDVGCGTGLLLRLLAERVPDAERLAGIDAAEGMISVANSTAHDSRITFSTAVAEELPYPDATFDLILSTTSFDHWQDQHVGLTQCFRVLAPGGQLVLTDLFSLWLAPTVISGHRGRARTRRRAEAVLKGAGFRTTEWHKLYAVIINTVVATK
jgi:ubiquinone/menaquinone biosynthesis C-methylase UbiE